MNIYTWIITLGIIYFPHILLLCANRLGYVRFKPKNYLVPHPILIIAGITYPIARFLPEPSLTEESVTLVQHFVGGGFVGALYFLYFSSVLKIRYPLPVMLILLYLVASGLGVANELLEFLATKLGLYDLDSSDVWWDLLANTLGALFLYILIVIWKNLTKKP